MRGEGIKVSECGSNKANKKKGGARKGMLGIDFSNEAFTGTPKHDPHLKHKIVIVLIC